MQKLVKRLTFARRGHKLLKDKFDELMRHFIEVIRESQGLRAEVEAALEDAYLDFAIARSEVTTPQLAESMAFPRAVAEVTVEQRVMVSLKVPSFELHTDGEADCYGLGLTPALFDSAVGKLKELLPQLVFLAEREKAIHMLAEEIETTRRRVNALEYVLIPQLEESVRFIRMKLDEFERSNLVRVMKIKDMVGDTI